MNSTSYTLLIGLMILCGVSSAQVSSTSTEKQTSTTIDLGFGLSCLDLSHNRVEQIRREVLDTNTINLIARSRGISVAERERLQIVANAGGTYIEVSHIGNDERALDLMSDGLRDYVEAREEGHTKAFLLAALSNDVPTQSIADTDLRVLLRERPLLPVSWVQKADYSGTRTNKAGQIARISTSTTIIDGRMQATSVTNKPKFDEVCRWVSYKVTDGDIEWLYVINLRADGQLDSIDETRRDAKEDDPKFQKVIKEVEDEVEAEMKNKGTFGRLGSVHKYWRQKKEKLKAKGIEWHSPAELNPNTRYD